MALRALRVSGSRAIQARPSRPMATASPHVSLSGYLFPRAKSSSSSSAGEPAHRDIQVGELEGTTFKIEPLRRTGETPATMRARLLYQSRKRGTLESDLILSTFAQARLPTMTPEQLVQYDLFLDENDWDIYYWATQEPPAEGAEAKPLTAAEKQARDFATQQSPRPGEWAQTVGTFKAAYRPVPARWKDSEILAQLRQHVQDQGMGKGGMAFMPSLE